MIIGLGIDIVDIARFAQWHTYTHARLARIFTEQEVEYCLSNRAKSAERFAVRFAAKEAFFKALSSAAPVHRIPLLTVCAAVGIDRNDDGSPSLAINWAALQKASLAPLPTHTMPLVSLSHTKTLATACVILQTK